MKTASAPAEFQVSNFIIPLVRIDDVEHAIAYQCLGFETLRVNGHLLLSPKLIDSEALLPLRQLSVKFGTKSTNMLYHSSLTLSPRVKAYFKDVNYLKLSHSLL